MTVDFVAQLKQRITQAGGRWPNRFDERWIYEELGRLYQRTSAVERLANLIREHGGRLEMTHEGIAERIGAHRETVSRMLLTPQFARVLTGLGSPRHAYGLAENPPLDLRLCSRCRLSATESWCPRCIAVRMRQHSVRQHRKKIKRKAIWTWEKPCELTP